MFAWLVKTRLRPSQRGVRGNMEQLLQLSTKRFPPAVKRKRVLHELNDAHLQQPEGSRTRTRYYCNIDY